MLIIKEYKMFAHNYNREYTDFIIELVRMTGCETYLELGVSEANNIHAIVPYCNRCIGVDILDGRHYNDFEFHKISTFDFFKEFKDKVDIIFIDADHNFESAINDFEQSLNILNKYGIILLHDTDPAEEVFLDPTLCSDSYRIIDWIHTYHPECNVLTIPVSVTGLTLVNRNKDRRIYGFSKT